MVTVITKALQIRPRLAHRVTRLDAGRQREPLPFHPVLEPRNSGATAAREVTETIERDTAVPRGIAHLALVAERCGCVDEVGHMRGLLRRFAAYARFYQVTNLANPLRMASVRDDF